MATAKNDWQLPTTLSKLQCQILTISSDLWQRQKMSCEKKCMQEEKAQTRKIIYYFKKEKTTLRK
jgi:hypothetical protein